MTWPVRHSWQSMIIGLYIFYIYIYIIFFHPGFNPERKNKLSQARTASFSTVVTSRDFTKKMKIDLFVCLQPTLYSKHKNSTKSYIVLFCAAGKIPFLTTNLTPDPPDLLKHGTRVHSYAQPLRNKSVAFVWVFSPVRQRVCL